MHDRKTVRPSDLPTKLVRSPDGKLIRMKVVQSDSPTLGLDMLAAFRSNVQRIRRGRRRDERDAANSTQS